MTTTHKRLPRGEQKALAFARSIHVEVPSNAAQTDLCCLLVVGTASGEDINCWLSRDHALAIASQLTQAANRQRGGLQ